ncbi:50S ribosomal protein L25 [Candidatus Parcubacteria bacterium]|nr:50S ribosomal protein L25 [Candidatus Parcubacteria bacterium]
MAAHTHKIELTAETRAVLGGKVKSLRRSGYVPGVLYGKGFASVPVQVPQKDFNKTLKTAGESTLVYLQVDGQVHPTIIHDVSRDPRTDVVIHADFYKVRLDEKIKTKVPVVFDGEAPAVKDFGGIFVRNVNELEVEALPQDLPHEIKIDVSVLKNIDDQIVLKDIVLDKIEVLGNPEEILATIQAPMSEEELKAALETPTESIEDVGKVEKEKDADAVLDETETPAGESKPKPEPESK